MAEQKIKRNKDRSLRTIVTEMTLQGMVFHPLIAGVHTVLFDKSFTDMLLDKNLITYTALYLAVSATFRLVTGKGYFDNWQEYK